MAATANTETNLAQLFRNRSATYADTPRWRQRRGDTVYQMTFRENQRYVNRLIAGLDHLGARPGDIIAIMSSTRWEWMATDWAILGIGAAVVTVYPSNVPETTAFILNDSGARYVFAEDRTQYAKLASIRDQIPNIRKVIVFEDIESAAGDDWVISLEALRDLSPLSDDAADELAAERAESIRPDELMTLVYTSGTTGIPKGVIHTHATFMAQLVGVRSMLTTVQPGKTHLLFLPLAHVYGREEHLSGLDQGLFTSVAESMDTLIRDLEESHPDGLFSVPRVYEKAYAGLFARTADSPIQHRILLWSTHVARAASRYRQQGRSLPPALQAQYAVADRLVFRKIRHAFGGQLEFAVSAAAPIEMHLLEFFDGAGVNLMEGWGMTETGGGYTLNQVEHKRLGTVGTVYPNNEARIADDGELLVRGPCIFKGYHNNAAATAEAFDANGWFHTGDIATMDSDGFIRIIDRKKDLIITAGGKNIAPQPIENLLKTVPGVAQAALYGDRKPYLVALLTADPEAALAWASEHNLHSSDLSKIVADPRYRRWIADGVARANGKLASYETVKYFEVLAEDFTVENDLMTPTLKIRRRAIHQRYRELYESLYQPAATPAHAPVSETSQAQ